ncbi:MAG: circadian clock KaiB family protein [Acidobacteria bacterium]|nr:circadian clock KaiB family protein [Acidobacteriota bacterium]
MKRKVQKNTDETKKFAKALFRQSPVGRYVLSLFVTGSTPKSLRAIQNIRSLCEEMLDGCYELRVIDIYQHPEQIKSEQIVVTPTLIKKLPLPLRILIGDLSNKERLLLALDIVRKNATI